MSAKLAIWTTHHPASVLIVWLAIGVACELAAPDWAEVAQDGDLRHLPPNSANARGERLLRRAFPDDQAKSQLALVFARNDATLTAADREFALTIADAIRSRRDLPIVDVWTEKTDVVGRMMVSAADQARLVVVRLHNDLMATDNRRVLDEIAELMLRWQQRAPPGLELGISGAAAIAGDMLDAAAESLRNTHGTAILLVALVLVIIYRAPLLILVTLTTIGVATWISLNGLALLAGAASGNPDGSFAISVFTTTRIFVVVLAFGAGTDYCLFLIARYKEELRGIGRTGRAIRRALLRVGAALCASAGTTVAGLAMMAVADYGKFAASGPSIAFCLSITLLAAVTLAPALLVLLRTAVFWPQGLGVSLLVALPLGWAGARTEVTYDLLGELNPNRVSVRGTQLLRQHFPPGEVGPLLVLARLPGAKLDTADGRLRIAHLSKPLEDLEGVSRVRSYYQPTGAPAGSTRLFTLEGALDLATQGSPLKKAAFVSQAGELAGETTRLQVVLSADPFEPRALAVCNQIEARLDSLRQDSSSPWFGAIFELYGTPIGIRDLRDVTTADQQRIQVAVVLAVFLVLVVILRRPVVCCYLIATVLASYLVALGATRLIFMLYYGATYSGLDWKVPIFLFVILVAVGQDYNVYFVTRVFEEQRRLGRLEGLRSALTQTGGVISSCGLIMAGTFVSMTAGTLRGMVELGVALTLGILLDTFVVRTILVPAFFARWERE